MVPANRRTLILNNDYSAHSVIDWQRAVSLMIQNQGDSREGAFVVELYPNDYIKDARGHKYPVPAVLALAKYVKPKRTMPFSRKNIFMRDKMRCMYCGVKFHYRDLTYDHVIPRCQWDQTKYGTPTHWSYIVTCCIPCNRLKAGRTPKEAGMKLIKKPTVPSGGSYVHGLSIWHKIDPLWEAYLPDLYKELVSNGV